VKINQVIVEIDRFLRLTFVKEKKLSLTYLL